MSTKQFLDRYSASLPEGSRAQYTAEAKRFLYWLEDRPMDVAAARRYMDKLKRDGYADATIHRLWGVVRRVYIISGTEWPFNRGEAPVVREKQVVALALAVEVVQRMIAVALGRVEPVGGPEPNDRHRCFLCLATVWGLRRQEMIAMTPEFLDQKHHTLFVETAKKGRQRYHQVPDYIMPHLATWGFREQVSDEQASRLFTDLKEMVGLSAPGSGWHSVRRACIKAAYNAGMNDPEVLSFYRWKRGGSSMGLRYATSGEIGFDGQQGDVSHDDQALDERVLEIHPFPKMWTPEVPDAR